jgi:hypothetical protein
MPKNKIPCEFGLNSQPNEHLLSLSLINPALSKASSLFVVEPIQQEKGLLMFHTHLYPLSSPAHFTK